MKEALKKAGSFRSLMRTLNIFMASINRYIKGTSLPEERFNLILDFLNYKNKYQTKRGEKVRNIFE